MARLRKRLDGSPFNCLSVHETPTRLGEIGREPAEKPRRLQAPSAAERGGSAGIVRLRHKAETSRDVAEAVMRILSLLGATCGRWRSSSSGGRAESIYTGSHDPGMCKNKYTSLKSS